MKYSNQGLLKESIAELFENEASSMDDLPEGKKPKGMNQLVLTADAHEKLKNAVKTATNNFKGQENIKPELPHHVTLGMKPETDVTKLGKEVTINVSEVYMDISAEGARVAAVKVDSVNPERNISSNPHITVAVFSGGSPVNSNALFGKVAEEKNEKGKTTNQKIVDLSNKVQVEMIKLSPLSLTAYHLNVTPENLSKYADDPVFISAIKPEESGSPQEIVSESIDLERWKKIAGIVKG